MHGHFRSQAGWGFDSVAEGRGSFWYHAPAAGERAQSCPSSALFGLLRARTRASDALQKTLQVAGNRPLRCRE